MPTLPAWMPEDSLCGSNGMGSSHVSAEDPGAGGLDPFLARCNLSQPAGRFPHPTSEVSGYLRGRSPVSGLRSRSEVPFQVDLEVA